MKKLQYVFMALAALCFAAPAFAQGGSGTVDLVPIGAGIGMALAAGLCGLGQGRATASATEALARNPGARSGVHWVPHTVHAGHYLCQGKVKLD
jgi:F-type H+-transporting ATPase subunit c